MTLSGLQFSLVQAYGDIEATLTKLDDPLLNRLEQTRLLATTGGHACRALRELQAEREFWELFRVQPSILAVAVNQIIFQKDHFARNVLPVSALFFEKLGYRPPPPASDFVEGARADFEALFLRRSLFNLEVRVIEARAAIERLATRTCSLTDEKVHEAHRRHQMSRLKKGVASVGLAIGSALLATVVKEPGVQNTLSDAGRAAIVLIAGSRLADQGRNQDWPKIVTDQEPTVHQIPLPDPSNERQEPGQ